MVMTTFCPYERTCVCAHSVRAHGPLSIHIHGEAHAPTPYLAPISSNTECPLPPPMGASF